MWGESVTDAEKREKVIKGLECCIPYESENNEHLCIYDDDYNPNCPYSGTGEYETSCMTKLMRDALALLKKSFTPQEVYNTVIEHAQHDMRFKLGDKINYSFTDVVDILNIEVMCKAGDM